MTTRPRQRIGSLDVRWMSAAACARIPGLPWIENPRQVPDFVVALMGEVCTDCPVLGQCTAFADQAQVTAGFWAGRGRHHLNVGDFHRQAGDKAA